MGIGIKLFAFLTWIAILYAIGIALFTRGFLLNRLEISRSSDCETDAVPFPSVRFLSSESQKSDNQNDNQNHCVQHQRFNKAIILVIDALRYDFAVFNESLRASKSLPFQNKLVTIRKLLREKPQHSLLYKFIADPPTTTLQRLKGLTTGSLPTFVDASSNFAGAEIVEDNIISQLYKSGKRVTFMGDDTWETLFKDKFIRSFPYPSFNVKDLHTVDNGVLSHLMPEISRNDWTVLIGHFLGVDHCGHRFGPYHSAMANKLTQMDEVLRDVVEDMDQDTILFVFGDHGMTNTGDHGGDSADEVGAALFVYSPSQLFEEDEQRRESTNTVSQVDFVPTLSLLLGLPIPFSNLGSIIPELFTTLPKHDSITKDMERLPKEMRVLFSKVAALRSNAHQVNTYIETYSKISNEFPHTESARLLEVFNKAEAILQNMSSLTKDSHRKVLDNLREAENLYEVYLSGVKEMCIGIWAQFDLMSMILGLISMGAVIVFCWMLIARTQSAGDRSTLNSTLETLLLTSFCVYASFLTLSIVLILFTDELEEASVSTIVLLPAIPSALVTIAMIVMHFLDGQLGYILRTHIFRNSKESIFCGILTAANAALYTSNSYIVYESYVSTYIVQSIIVFWFLSTGLSQSRTTKEALTKKTKIEKSRDIGHLITHPRTILVLFLAVFLVCVRFSTYFFACREEQYPCEESTFLRPLASFTDEKSEYRHYRYFVSVACLAMLPASLSYWLNKQGNLNGTSASSLSITYALPAATVCVCLHWGLQSLPEKILDNIPGWEQVILARIAYVLLGISMGSLIYDPMCVYLVPKKDRLKLANSGDSSVSDDAAAPKVVERPKGMRKRNPRQSVEEAPSSDSADPPGFIPPIVYGLGTVFSSGFLQGGVTICLLLAMLLGDGFAPAVLLLICQAMMFLELYAIIRRAHLKVLEMFPGLMQLGLLQVPWYAIAGWGFMANQYFFATGHHATVPSIRFESAFVGFYGDFPKYMYFIPALLISLNTFASQILFAVVLPLLVVWPYTRGRLFEKKKTEEDRKGEMNMHLNPDELRIAMFQLFVQYMVFHAIQVFGTMLSATIHRRHLMAWKIFAPRFVFQGASFLVVSIVLVLMYPIFIRIDMALSKWLQRLFDEV